MITKARAVNIYVGDQQRALEFYTEKLGFEVRADDSSMPGMRWIEVAPPGADTTLILFTPPGLEERVGTWSPVVFDSDDIDATYAKLRENGVEFSQPLAMQPWGMKMAQFKDPDGNEFVLVQYQS
jgi:predicted enzyme related to lactoylglutathione lyase